LFPIGYGPTPSKRKDIVLQQEVVKGFKLVLIDKGRIFWRKGFYVAKVSGNPFPSDGKQGICNVSK
jgi:hypothetical protein